MNNSFRFLVVVLLISLTFLSCDEKQDLSSMVVSSNSLQFGSEEETQILIITSNENWTITSDVSWVKVSPNSGSGNSQISIAVDPNDSEEVRTTKLRVHYATIIQPIVITQNASTSLMPD